ncbi:hypothetical protein [Loigolactobacillus coryniformis]|uniref:hypothetical protein n=1 Tax=Loigolactobacillus coryniformis TaxID=1610 RepID=UPI0002DE44C9|nr:hypothetical protein [Loigolactobacillus coryniformis]
MNNKILYLIRKALSLWQIKLKYLHYLNSVLLMASAIVYMAFLTMTARYNHTNFNTLLQSNLIFSVMVILVSLNFIIGAILLYYQQRLLKNRYELKIILIVQIIQQALALNPILFIIGGLELIQATADPIKGQPLNSLLKVILILLTAIYLLFGIINFGLII